MFLTYNLAPYTPSNNPETIFQIFAPTNHDVYVRSLEVMMFGTTGASAAILFKWCTQDGAGTSSDDSAALFKDIPASANTIQTTMRKTFTAEPSTNTVREQFAVHQQASGQRLPNNPDRRLVVEGGTRLGLRIYTAVAFTIGFSVSIQE